MAEEKERRKGEREEMERARPGEAPPASLPSSLLGDIVIWR